MNNFLFSFVGILFGLIFTPVSSINNNVDVSPQPVTIEEPAPTVPTDSEILQLSPKADALLDKELIQPLNKISDIKIDKEMFSRCGSGFFYSLEEKNAQFFKGNVIFSNGCESSNTICTFRINRSGTKLEVLNKKNKTYISAEEWLKGYEPKPL